ncbi:alternate signal-mediated exported protein, RER_14450 family [Actinomyces bovis]|uniref:Alternate signal-mediated exported protein, RER_14450 family n=1 Tax=Actinomyces bovis TaxID=1658 RepID=A0ABY1VLC0_9ACTO|nr:alternate-type signal peptide domain-containing protein [Actinomyces bovis]SPT52890.1 alternate signal-mediated exported protein, RER_14450 family [Actinomyces bovis]VEG55022.1 alternate signal-mediated exported protein, RER_14450 family [Actinomyces israelii]
MSRTSRALIAGGAALALLAGSGATFARWYDEKPVTTGTVNTGSLRILDSDKPDVWLINTQTEGTDAEPSATFDPAKDKLVPGDVVTLTKHVKVEIVGKNLVATFAAQNSAGTLPKGLTASYETDCADGANLSFLTEAQNGKECTVKATFVYHKGGKDEVGGENSGSALPENLPTGPTHGEGWHKPSDGEQNRAIPLGDIKLVLEQHDRPGAPIPAP